MPFVLRVPNEVLLLQMTETGGAAVKDAGRAFVAPYVFASSDVRKPESADADKSARDRYRGNSGRRGSMEMRSSSGFGALAQASPETSQSGTAFLF